MQKKELKNLSRGDLLELLIEQTEKADNLEKELRETQRKLESRDLVISNAGSLAEAAMQINEVWQAADRAASQYLSSIMNMYQDQYGRAAQIEQDCEKKTQELLSGTTEKCRRMEAETKQRCDEMLHKAQVDSQAYWDAVYEKLEQYCAAQDGLRSMLRMKD